MCTEVGQHWDYHMLRLQQEKYIYQLRQLAVKTQNTGEDFTM